MGSTRPANEPLGSRSGHPRLNTILPTVQTFRAVRSQWTVQFRPIGRIAPAHPPYLGAPFAIRMRKVHARAALPLHGMHIAWADTSSAFFYFSVDPGFVRVAAVSPRVFPRPTFPVGS